MGLRMALGLHGQKFKFMPMTRGSTEDHFPRIIQIAGVYPGVTPEDVMAPSSTPAAEPGFWTYSFPDPDDPNVGTIAVPGSDVITEAADPVAIIASSSSLGISGQEMEVVVIIDRGDINFYTDGFYAFRSEQNEVQIMCADSADDFYSILGRVVICMTPASKDGKKPSGFLEDDD